MKRLKKIIFIALLAQFVLVAKASQVNDDSLSVEILLNNKILNGFQINEKFINNFDITSDNLILLSSNNKFYLLGWGGIQAVGQKTTDTISSFAYTPDGLLMVVRNNMLCYMDSLGKLSKLYGLPNNGMGLSSGENVMYLYDRSKDLKSYALYVLAKGGKYSKLFEIHTPINSVVETNNSILFSSANTLYNYNLKENDLKAVVTLKDDKEIKSISVDTLSNMIFLSSENAIYAFKDSCMINITDKFVGMLKYFKEGLIVFNAEKKFLIRITGIENEISSKINELKSVGIKKQTINALTNTSIINMVKEKLSDELIINIIKSSNVDFNVSVDSMINLSNNNVSSAVIKEMKNAMKKKTTNNTNK